MENAEPTSISSRYSVSNGTRNDDSKPGGIDRRRKGTEEHLQNEKASRTQFIGVTRLRKKFQARIHVFGKLVYLGSFDTPIQAARAYNKQARKFKKKLNDIPDSDPYDIKSSRFASLPDSATVPLSVPSKKRKRSHGRRVGHTASEPIQLADAGSSKEEEERSINRLSSIRPRRNTESSKYKGVTRNLGGFTAVYVHEGVRINLGTFMLELDAARAYNKYAKHYNKPLNQLPKEATLNDEEEEDEEEGDDEGEVVRKGAGRRLGKKRRKGDRNSFSSPSQVAQLHDDDNTDDEASSSSHDSKLDYLYHRTTPKCTRPAAKITQPPRSAGRVGSRSSTGYRGIHRLKDGNRPFCVRVYVANKKLFGGKHLTLFEALRAYNALAKKHGVAPHPLPPPPARLKKEKKTTMRKEKKKERQKKPAKKKSKEKIRARKKMKKEAGTSLGSSAHSLPPPSYLGVALGITSGKFEARISLYGETHSVGWFETPLEAASYSVVMVVVAVGIDSSNQPSVCIASEAYNKVAKLYGHPLNDFSALSPHPPPNNLTTKNRSRSIAQQTARAKKSNGGDGTKGAKKASGLDGRTGSRGRATFKKAIGTKYIGVRQNAPDRFQAQISVEGRTLHIGTFASVKEAARAFNKHAQSLGRQVNEVSDSEVEIGENVMEIEQQLQEEGALLNLACSGSEDGELTLGDLASRLKATERTEKEGWPPRGDDGVGKPKAEIEGREMNHKIPTWNEAFVASIGINAWRRIRPILEKEEIGMDVVDSCTEEDLKEIGLLIGDRRRVGKAIKILTRMKK
eukprot:jgi/Bigna1/86660/estExt_fgenesh1_pg.C_120166